MLAAFGTTVETPKFSLPIDCEPGLTCFIQNFVDMDPSPSYRDYACGYLSYDGHRGTDFRLPDLDAMRRGVRVLAAAPGIVRAIRDGMPDISVKKIDSKLIAKHEAGNAVVIRHGNGWVTQYSHMRRGSVMVKPGEHVTAGQPLGLVGLSGNTEFPHVDFAVRHNGQVVDPFTGLGPAAGCGQTTASGLWSPDAAKKLIYQSSGILVAGFTDVLPQTRPLYEYLDKKSVLPATARRIIFWVHVFGLQAGDVEHLQLIGPDGKVLAEKKKTIDNNFARYLDLTGTTKTIHSWPPGDYEGLYTLQRKANGTKVPLISKSYRLRIKGIE